jgi:5-formyltetrahydrofolate cyclo-ligase
MKNKCEIRKELQLVRRMLSLQRRKKAEEDCCATLFPLFSSFSHVLSFSSLRDEINLQPLNKLLCQQKKLLLPRIENDEVAVYQVLDLENDLQTGSFGILEPIPEKCQKIDPVIIEYVLVPGLAFDDSGGRIGYGKGHYDRFLLHVRGMKVGVGFKEQLVDFPLAKEAHDQRLDRLLLF